jgi:hypothetical protein
VQLSGGFDDHASIIPVWRNERKTRYGETRGAMR